MITIKDFMEAVNYRITEGDPYGWQCYGPNAFYLDSWNGDHDGYSAGMVFDTVTQVVYEMTVCDYKRERAYRWQNPDFIEKYNREAKYKANSDEAWENVKFHNLDVKEDMLEKTKAIVNDIEYDTRVQVPVDLTDDELFHIMKLAHERDITLNQMIELIVNDAILEAKNNKNYEV